MRLLTRRSRRRLDPHALGIVRIVVLVLLEEGILFVPGSLRATGGRAKQWFGRVHTPTPTPTSTTPSIDTPDLLRQTLLPLQPVTRTATTTIPTAPMPPSAIVAMILTLPPLNRRPTRRRALQERRRAQAHTLGAMDRFDARGGVELFGLAAAAGGEGRGAEIGIAFLAAAVELVEVDVGAVGAGAAEGHVGGVLGEGLHGRVAEVFAVAVGVAGVKGPVVVED